MSEKFYRDIFALEYSDKQRMFHYNSGEMPENTNGYVTLKYMSWHECTDFTKFMDKKYVNGRSTGILPELKVVKLELDLFFSLKNTRRKLAGRI